MAPVAKTYYLKSENPRPIRASIRQSQFYSGFAGLLRSSCPTINMRITKEPNSKRTFRKRRRSYEPRLKEALQHYFKAISSINNLSPEDLNQLILRIRWPIYGLTYWHLKLCRDWWLRDFFLEIPDIESIELREGAKESVIVTGEIIWWAQGKDGKGIWWPPDRTLEKAGSFNGYLIDPFKAKIFPEWNRTGGLRYEIEFGLGGTFRFFTNYKTR